MNGLLARLYRINTTMVAIDSMLRAHQSAVKTKEAIEAARKRQDDRLAAFREQDYIRQIACNGHKPLIWGKGGRGGKFYVIARQELA